MSAGSITLGMPRVSPASNAFLQLPLTSCGNKESMSLQVFISGLFNLIKKSAINYYCVCCYKYTNASTFPASKILVKMLARVIRHKTITISKCLLMEYANKITGTLPRLSIDILSQGKVVRRMKYFMIITTSVGDELYKRYLHQIRSELMNNRAKCHSVSPRCR